MNNKSSFKKSKFLPFEEARNIARSLGLNSSKEWRKWSKSGDKPDNIPANPARTYKAKGWKGFGDWLGTGVIANQDRVYLPFKEARNYARSLGLNSQGEWLEWTKSEDKPDNIPANPRQVYKNKGWNGFGDWLGTGNLAPKDHEYLPFEEAKKYARSLGLNSNREWLEWSKSGDKPDNIPAYPQDVYKKKGWAGSGDWLGTGTIAPQDRVYLPFEEARNYARSLGINSQGEWREWSKSGDKPDDIPAAPDRVYRAKGWNGFGDWLGTGNLAPKDHEYLPFEEARNYIHSLGLNSHKEWREWSKSGDRPDNIPATPLQVYKAKGWKGFGDWLGTGTIANQDRVYLPFEDARNYVCNLGLKSQGEWRKWAKSDERPENIPSTPERVYMKKGWEGVGDWLGTGTIASQNLNYLPFEDAKQYVRSLGLKSQKEWQSWSKSGEKPDSIPADPGNTYKAKGWEGFGDWLGTERIANQDREFLPFEEARNYVRSLGIKSAEEWAEWYKSGDKPDNIPTKPSRVYKNQGWIGFGDWLGQVNRWNNNSIIAFLKALQPIIQNLEPSELYSILRQNGLLEVLKNKGSHTQTGLLGKITKLSTLQDLDGAEQLIDEIIQDEFDLPDDRVVDSEEDSIKNEIRPEHEEKGVLEELPTMSAGNILSVLDHLDNLYVSPDAEVIEFFVAKAVAKLWHYVFVNLTDFSFDQLQDYGGGEYAIIARERFLKQFTSTKNLSIPNGYDFKIQGEVIPPNLMQRLIAYRLTIEKRVGNWSGTGAGKTLAAILSSRIIDSRLNIIIALNNTLMGWKQEILNAFPDSEVLIKEKGMLSINSNKHTYILLNYEAFQQPASASMVRNLVNQHKIDFIIIDEIHNAKKRDKAETKRRHIIEGLLSSAQENNPGLHVLGMSATPVVNDLTEAVSLLEMVQGVKFDDLKTFPNISNAIAIHEKLILHGIRYKPKYKQSLNVTTPEISGEHLISKLKDTKKGDILGLEQKLLEAKIPKILEELEPGTIIYTQYVENIVDVLTKTLQLKNYRVAQFTGQNKSGIKEFLEKRADILIGSSTMGTGIDGLQYRCSKMIMVTLPWTSASFEQLIGRIHRQGSVFKHIEIVIPKVVIHMGEEEWSWDQQRLDRIKFKKTLADAAVDGVIPEGILEKPASLHRRALKALEGWIKRLDETENPLIIDRQRLCVPLPEDEKQKALRKLGDFSRMNGRWNNAKSSTTHERLSRDASEWYLYHTLYREQRQNWTEIPYETFIEWLNDRPDLVVGDFGCGESIISKSVSNKVFSFDHIAVDDSVIACDMTHVPLEDNILNVALFSLSLMGSNFGDYLKEAHRVLKIDGVLKIAEPKNRWYPDKHKFLREIIESSGFEIIGDFKIDTAFLYINAMKSQ